ncbi:extracellular solute-binding protein [Lachnospira eligens]|jgi:putative aldouronate transport system substrate-binding protein|uniref:Extracellular solute-binding protein n=1 Tax=Lachnospira eligens TaxID=39485 RepID=A0A415MCN2_9FIRM|nr:extracellular solute-binding protein [Lachnospira eligens]RHA48511.1 extracellular solute-binding protein [Lachnospira eligens]RHK46093.1 extracellular solute-binding protein [Lachnospira eligens]RHL69122.1 extracellular solute-binding protein [Lachnospira eligens]
MNRLKQTLKKSVAFGVTGIMLILAGCKSPAGFVSNDNEEYNARMEEARTTPFGAYPETIEYTLGKMTSVNNSNMPENDTYTDNAYTRYIKSVINVQNVDAFEANDSQYDTNVSMAISMGSLPDIMVVSSQDEVEQLVGAGLIEDLTESYNNCISDRIRKMYESYGDSLKDMVTYDGKIMALPETNITDGPNLVWLRKDWMDKLGLSEPHTIDDVVNIVKHFISEDPGNNGEDASGKPNTVGLAVDTDVTGECGYSSEFLLDIIFACFGAYPKQWIMNDDGEIVYGSVTDEAKEALSYINSLYNQGVIDNDFLLRTSTNICELIENGLCGSFFGPWWAPNNPLANAVSKNPDADWQPYLIATDSDGTTSYHSQNPCYKYVVVRKGYEHPEIAAKMISVMFDKVRFDCTDSEEFKNYYQLNVEPTARPLSINVDYNNALSICYRNIDATISGRKNPDSLELLERSFYDACSEYIKNANKTSTQWAAYMSRIKACSLIAQDNIKVVDSLYFKTTDTMKSHWWRLKAKEKEAYLKIISGEEDISYFDTFVKEWNEQGGQIITSEVSESMK